MTEKYQNKKAGERMSQVILFDLDGTLTESGEGITKCVQYALDKMGIVENDLEKLECFIGPPLKDSFMKYAGLNEEQAAQAIIYYRERYETQGMYENRLYPKVPELLELLQINDKILGVASSKPEKYVKQLLEYFEIASYFQVIVGSEMDGRRVTKAEVIETALEKLEMKTERDKVIMVGDRAEDALGAISCGIQCVGAAYGYGGREELEQAGAVYIADTVEDLAVLASPNDEETTEHVESIRKHHLWKRKQKVSAKKETKTEDLEVGPLELSEEVKEIMENDQTAEDSADLDKSVKKTPGNVIYNIWRCAYPIFIHYGASILAMIIATAYYTVSYMNGSGAADGAGLYDQIMGSSLKQLVFTSVVAGTITFLLYRSDQKKRKEGFLGNGQDFAWCPPIVWVSVIVLAIAGCQMLNDLIQIFRLNELFPSYAQLSEETMAGQPVGLLILTVGILAPVVEELVFRGLVFRRMKDWVHPWIAILFSSLLFGIYHGNFVQFLYATFMGMLLAVIYERTGTLWTAVVAHMTANLWSLFGYGWWLMLAEQIPFGAFLGIVVELLLCVIPGYWIFVYKRKSK